MKFYKLCKALFAVIVKTFFPVSVINAENEPTDIPVLVCANHISLWDPILIAVCLRTPIHFMGKVELFKVPVLSFLIKALGAFPVTRSGVDITSIKSAIAFLKNGENVGMFPQGTRHGGKPLRETEVKSGVGMVLMRSEASALPVAIVTDGNKIKLFKRIRIVVGKPMSFVGFETGEKSRAEFQRISDSIFNEICVLEETERKERMNKNAL